MRVFVAGSTGAIGRFLVPQLLAGGHEVIALSRDGRKAGAPDAMWKPLYASWRRGFVEGLGEGPGLIL